MRWGGYHCQRLLDVTTTRHPTNDNFGETGGAHKSTPSRYSTYDGWIDEDVLNPRIADITMFGVELLAQGLPIAPSFAWHFVKFQGWMVFTLDSSPLRFIWSDFSSSGNFVWCTSGLEFNPSCFKGSRALMFHMMYGSTRLVLLDFSDLAE